MQNYNLLLVLPRAANLQCTELNSLSRKSCFWGMDSEALYTLLVSFLSPNSAVPDSTHTRTHMNSENVPTESWRPYITIKKTDGKWWQNQHSVPTDKCEAWQRKVSWGNSLFLLVGGVIEMCIIQCVNLGIGLSSLALEIWEVNFEEGRALQEDLGRV